MVEPFHTFDPALDATYELRVEGPIPAVLRELYPSMRVSTRPAGTVLYRDITDVAELDVLLEQLQTMGMTLTELRAVPTIAGTGGSSCTQDDHDD